MCVAYANEIKLLAFGIFCFYFSKFTKKIKKKKILINDFFKKVLNTFDDIFLITLYLWFAYSFQKKFEEKTNKY